MQVYEGFSLLADESTDEAQCEQLCLIVKYKVRGQPAIKEYLDLINLSKVITRAITSVKKLWLSNALRLVIVFWIRW